MLVENKVIWQTLLIAIVIVKISSANTAEIQSFGYLGYEGELNLDYLLEDNFNTTEKPEVSAITGNLTGNTLTNSRNDRRVVKQANLDLLFHTFIYHPNFLKFDIGIGLAQTQSSVDLAQVENGVQLTETRYTNDSTAFDYNFLLSFFEKKDYPFSLYYSKKTPPLTAASSDAFISKNTRYGAKFLWNAPIIINVDAIHFDTSGSSNLRVIKESIDSTSFRAYRLNQSNGYQQFSFNHQVSRSESGSIDDVIIETLNITDDVNYANQISFGEFEQFDFSLNVNYQQNRKAFEFNDTTILPEFKWAHTEKLKSYYQLAYKINEFQDYKVVTQSVLAGLSFNDLDGISNVVNLSASRTELPAASNAQNDLRDSLSYVTRFSGGSLALNGLVSIGQNESRTDSGTSAIVRYEERSVKLDANHRGGVTEIKFTYPNVIEDESNVIVISSATRERTGTYTRNVDYEVINRNGVVSIRILRSESFALGEKLLLAYSYDTGSNNVFQTKTVAVTSKLNFFDYYNTFAGITNYNIDVIEGSVSNTQVTERVTRYYGAGIDLPIYGDDILVGGEVRREQTRENITSTNSTTQLLYTQFRVFQTGSIYISRRKIESDYIGVVGLDNDVNKVTYHALFKIQPTHRTILSLIYDDSEDVGSIIARRYTESSLKYEWHYRRILLNLTATLLKDSQGTQRRDRTAIHLNIIRTF